MVDQVRTSLGSHFAPFFDRPVDAKLVPDYYSVIKRPMDLGTLKQKLHDGHYGAPQQFAEVTSLRLTAIVQDIFSVICWVICTLFVTWIFLGFRCVYQVPRLTSCCCCVGHEADLDKLPPLQQEGDPHR